MRRPRLLSLETITGRVSREARCNLIEQKIKGKVILTKRLKMRKNVLMTDLEFQGH